MRATGTSEAKNGGESLPIDRFFVAKPSNGASAINAALERGQNVLLTPGVYELNEPIHVTRPDTVVLGMGYATLLPTNGTPAIEIDDVPGAIVLLLIVDAGDKNSDVLVRVGSLGATHGVETNPSTMVDVFIRCGGAVAGKATTSIELNQNYSLINHTWIWRFHLMPHIA